MRNLQYTILLVLTAFLSIVSAGQTTVYNSLSIVNGLNSNTIYSLYEDKDGFLWVGTDQGLQVYNGSTFRDIDLPDDYESFEIYKIWEHPDSCNIWVSANNCRIYQVVDYKLVPYERNEMLRKIRGANRFFSDVGYNENNQLVTTLRNSGSHQIEGPKEQQESDLTFNWRNKKWNLNIDKGLPKYFKKRSTIAVKDSSGKKIYFELETNDDQNFYEYRSAGNKSFISFSIGNKLYTINLINN